MRLEKEQEELLAEMVEGGRGVPRAEREWLFVSFGQGAFLQGPGIGREDVPAGDLQMLEREGLIHVISYSPRDGNPTYVITPEGHNFYRQSLDKDPTARQETELRHFLNSDGFKARYSEAYAKWSEAESLLWSADSEREFTTIGHKVREALQEFATAAVEEHKPENVESDPALVNRRLGAVIAGLLPELASIHQ